MEQVPASYLDGSTASTVIFGGIPLGVTFDQCAPPSRVIWTRPSFVPAQIWPFSAGDSAREKTTPAYSTLRLSTVRPPESPCMLASFSVKSGLIVRHVCPPSEVL